MKKISVQGQRFIDSKGNTVILHGTNMVCKDKSKNYIGGYTSRDFKQLKEWGFNVIRLGIIWDGLEPEPGKMDYVYLDKVEEIVKLAKEQEIYVYLDMHQDLFSAQYADGAPEWATLTEGKEHIQTGLWSESYLLSEAVWSAFDNFWNNTKAEDGKGIQDHYICVWQEVAKRFKAHENVIGYDMMNEPFVGSYVQQIIGTLLVSFSQLLDPNEIPDLEKVQSLWLDPSKKEELMSILADREFYNNLVINCKEVSQRFDKEILSSFYQRVRDAIREIDTENMVLMETNYFSNMGIECGIEVVKDEKGQKDCAQVYSPHGYDLLVDTNMYHISSNNRIDTIFDTHKKVQERLDIPMLVGEWGCYPKAKEEQLPQAAYITGLFEKYLASDTYYEFSQLYDNLITNVLVRAYPMQVAGELKSYHYDYITKSFECEYSEQNNEGDETIIYVPYVDEKTKIEVIPEGSKYLIEEIHESHAVYLKIPKAELSNGRIIKIIQK